MLSRIPSVVKNWDITTNLIENALPVLLGITLPVEDIIAAKMQNAGYGILINDD